ncbi:MAG: hypothetical protein ACOX3Q_11860 [Clostridia bacterium]|jgi:tetrahydromethanopterin S-methyltransferase subunit B|nr:DUF5329 domain-containing protein [Clostridiaceae bacterium]
MYSKKEKRMKAIIALAAVMCSFIVYGSLVSATSPNNVIVASVNYVDEKFNQIMQKVNQLEARIGTGGTPSVPTYPGTQPGQQVSSEALQKLEEKIDKLEGRIKNADFVARAASESSKYSVVVLEKGQTLIAGDVIEFIVRSGVCTAIEGANGDGIADMTSGDGKDFYTGDQLPKNHYMLISRPDGRGIKAVSDTVYLMVKGMYSIYLADN